MKQIDGDSTKAEEDQSPPGKDEPLLKLSITKSQARNKAYYDGSLKA